MRTHSADMELLGGKEYVYYSNILLIWGNWICVFNFERIEFRFKQPVCAGEKVIKEKPLYQC